MEEQPMKGQNKATGAKKGQNKATGAKKGQNKVTGAKKGQNKATGAKKGQNKATGAKKGQNKVTGARKVKNKATGSENNMKTTFHTEGYIKEFTVKGTGISITLDPTEGFAFGEGESNSKKIVLLDEKENVVLVARSEEFKSGKKWDTSLLYSLKRDRAKLRVSVEEVSTLTITSITII